MTTKRKIKDLRDCLHRILENPSETATIKASIDQCLRIDKPELEVLEKSDRNIFIIQAAQINSKVVAESSKALSYVNDIEQGILNSGDLDGALNKMFELGWTWPELKSLIEEKYFEIASEHSSCQTDAAEKLGLKRTTYLAKLKRIEDMRVE